MDKSNNKELEITFSGYKFSKYKMHVRSIELCNNCMTNEIDIYCENCEIEYLYEIKDSYKNYDFERFRNKYNSITVKFQDYYDIEEDFTESGYCNKYRDVEYDDYDEGESPFDDKDFNNEINRLANLFNNNKKTELLNDSREFIIYLINILPCNLKFLVEDGKSLNNDELMNTLNIVKNVYNTEIKIYVKNTGFYNFLINYE